MNIRKVSYELDDVPPVFWIAVHSPRTNRPYKVAAYSANGKWHLDWETVTEVAHKCGCEVNDLEIYY